jgi:putative hydrolase
MIECDLHLHSIRSACGFHTLFEIVTIMQNKGQKGFALTDHGPSLGTPWNHFSVLLKRMPAEVDGIRVFKGIESSVLNTEGEIDTPVFAGFSYEIILAGLHPQGDFIESRGTAENTLALVNAVKRNPAIRGITHPTYLTLPTDLDRLTDLAAERNIALEINNAHLRSGKADKELTLRMLEFAREKGAPLMINSDGHVFTEMGEYERALDVIEPFGADRLRIVNRTLAGTLAFLGLEK